MAILRNDADTMDGRAGRPCQRTAIGNHAVDRVGERRLSVAFDAGDADDLARKNVERYAVCAGLRSAGAQVLEGQTGLRRGLRALRDDGQVASDHRARDLVDVRVFRLHCGHELSMTHDADPAAVRYHLGKLVRDDENRRPALRERDDRRKKSCNLGRRERRRRLVEEEYCRIALELSKELDTLLDADGKIFDERIGIDLERVALRELGYAFARGARVDARAAARLASEQDVLPHVKPPDELEVLVNEADGAVRLDRSRIGLQFAEGDGCERGFACSVFADERVNFAGVQIEVDAVDGDDAGERLANAVHAQRECVAHGSATGLKVASPARVYGGTIRPSSIARSMSASRARRAGPIAFLV